MNYPGHDAAEPWCGFPAGEGAGDGDAAAAAAGDTSSSFADMLADYSTDDLFDLAGEQGEGASSAPGSTTTTTMPPAEPCLWSPPPGVPLGPPSEYEMAAWLTAIVKGEDLAFTGDDREHVVEKGSSDASDDTKEKLPIMEWTGSKQEIKNLPEGGSSRRSHHGEAHNLTEKRRRHKIKERLKTLQQLVPGCDKSNQASTLDQTIQYMKSLQRHVQQMSGGPACSTPAVPVVPPRYAPPGVPVTVPMMPAPQMVLAPAPTTMVPFGSMVHLPHYPVAVPVVMPAAAASMYPVAASARATVAHDLLSDIHKAQAAARERALVADATNTELDHQV